MRLCGVAGKARLPTEACPGSDSDQPSMSRWGEPLLLSHRASGGTRSDDHAGNLM